MKTLPTNLIIAKNLISNPNPWLLLLEVNIDESTVLYFVRNTEDITYDGQLYTAFPFEVAPIQNFSKGEIPSLQIKVCNITRLLQTYIEDADIIGNNIVVRSVNNDLLTEDYTNLSRTFMILSVVADAQWIVFSCGLPNPMNKRFPLYKYVGEQCNWSFNYPDGTSVDCGYKGALTTCERTWTDCQTHKNTARFGGARGLVGGGIRIAS